MIGHVSGLEVTIAQIAGYDQQVADSLQKMVQRYDYSGIMTLAGEEA
jgi:hypothetical protein